MALQENQEIKDADWSLNLEDPYYEDHTEQLFEEAIEAVQKTKEGHFVNLVTPASCGDPKDWLIPFLKQALDELPVQYKDIQFVDECGCGGFVTRVTR